MDGSKLTKTLLKTWNGNKTKENPINWMKKKNSRRKGRICYWLEFDEDETITCAKITKVQAIANATIADSFVFFIRCRTQ